MVAEKPKMEFEYIELTKSVSLQIYSRRVTTIYEEACGYILDRENINTIWDINDAQKAGLLERLEMAEKDGKILALVAGYPISLSKNEFVTRKTNFPPRIAWEIII